MPAKRSKDAPRDASGAAARGAALVVDDHPVTRYGLVRMLEEQLGFAPAEEAERFDEALELLAGKAFALAVFDLGMPGLSSPRELARVRRLWPELRVVVLSASSDRTDILAALEAGVHGYIVKDARADWLVDRLRYVMSGEIYVPPCMAMLPSREQAAQPHTDRVAERAAAHSLSDRQRQVLEGLVNGLSNKQIARDLQLAEGTVKMHIGALFRALGATNRAHAAALGKSLLG